MWLLISNIKSSFVATYRGVSINKGLHVLGNVVSALASKSSTAGHVHVPYRESKLTRLLKDSLGGNGMTVLLACVSPAEGNCEETINTLRFASRASSVVNKAKVNTDNCGNAEMSALREELASLRLKLVELEGQKLPLVSHRDGDDREMFARLAAHMNRLLLLCLEEGVFVEDAEVASLHQDLDKVRVRFGMQRFAICSSSAQDFIPAVMTAIEDLKTLRNQLLGEPIEDKVVNLRFITLHYITLPSLITERKRLESPFAGKRWRRFSRAIYGE